MKQAHQLHYACRKIGSHRIYDCSNHPVHIVRRVYTSFCRLSEKRQMKVCSYNVSLSDNTSNQNHFKIFRRRKPLQLPFSAVPSQSNTIQRHVNFVNEQLITVQNLIILYQCIFNNYQAYNSTGSAFVFQALRKIIVAYLETNKAQNLAKPYICSMFLIESNF